MKLSEVLYFHDEPLLAIFHSQEHEMFLGIKMEDDGNVFPEYERPFLLTPLATDVLQRIRSNDIRLRTAFEAGKKWYVCDVLKNTEKLSELGYDDAKSHFPGNVYLGKT